MRHQAIRPDVESGYSQRYKRWCFTGTGYGQKALGKTVINSFYKFAFWQQASLSPFLKVFS